MKEPIIDETKLLEVMKIIDEAVSLMEEKNCETDEAEMDYWLKYLKVNTGLRNLTDYIFYPDTVGLDLKASLEQIADKIVEDRQ